MRSRLSVLAIAFAVVSLVACGGKSERKAAGGGGEKLVIEFDASPTNLDSRVGNDNASGRTFDLIYNGLMKATPQGDFAPDLAEKFETPDDKTIVFHLRPNVKFHNGQTMTSADVKSTYDSLLDPAFTTSKKSGYSTVQSIEAPDPQTIVFHLKEPNSGIFENLTLGIVPKGADTNTYKTKPIGTGPYKVVNFAPDDRVELEAFDQYFAGPPNIRNVVIRIIPDATTRVLELRRGSCNFELNSIPVDSVDQFKKDNKFTVVEKPGAVYQYLAFNLKDPNLGKKEVRQAIAHAIDRQRIVKDLLRGYGKVTDSMFPEGHWARAGNLSDFDYDPAKAKQMLDAAGVKDPDGDGPKMRFNAVYKTSTDAEAVQQAEMIQQMLKAVGIGVQIQSNEFGTFYEDIQNGKFQMFSLRRAGIADPDFYYVIFHSSNLPPEGQNRGYYVNKQVDQLIEQGRSTFDRAKRKEAYDKVQTILADELPYISLYHRTNLAVMRSNVGGFEMYPNAFLLSVPQMTMK